MNQKRKLTVEITTMVNYTSITMIQEMEIISHGNAYKDDLDTFYERLYGEHTVAIITKDEVIE